MDTPIRIVFLGDFSGRSNRRLDPGLEGRRAVQVDREDLDAILARVRPSLRLTVPGVAEPIEIRFEELDAFHPDSLWQRLPVFAALQQSRERLEDNAGYARAQVIQEPVEDPEPRPGAGLLDQIVASSSPPARSEAPSMEREDVWSRAIRSIVEPHIVPKPDRRRGEAIAELDASAADLMRAVLGHPDFQALEAAWRSLFLLLSRLETGPDLKLYLIDASREDVIADLLRAPDLRSTNVHRLLADEGPWTVVGGLYSFAPTDAALLERLGAIAYSSGATLLSAASPRFAEGLSEDEDRAWNALRGSPVAESIGLVWPRFLLRLPYGPKTSSTDLFQFEEMPAPPAHDAYLWGNPAVAAACAVAGASRELQGLPVHTWRDAEGEPQMTPCAEIWLTEARAMRLLDLGVMPLVSIQGRDAARLLRLQSVAEPPTPLGGAWR